MKWKIKRGDQVEVIAGDDRGKKGEVLSISSGSVPRLVVMGVNKHKKGLRKSQQHPDGLTVYIEMPIHLSNVRKVEEEKKAE
ncbi:MAG: 50S ribosomal protein L24 [Puniceicoccales bacterium]|jgi:large subunit ribosomal protein L24|nr:50S ribosomal protein L24 [Puniceicoccales bacterium]